MIYFEALSWHFASGTGKTKKNISQDCWSSGQDLNLGPPIYKAIVLNNQSRHLVYDTQFLLNGSITIKRLCGNHKLTVT
jgi:hypothetical protein